MLELNKIAKQYHSDTNVFGYLWRLPVFAALVALYVIASTLFLLPADTLVGGIAKFSAMVVALVAAMVLFPCALARAQSKTISHFNKENLVRGEYFDDGDYDLAKKKYLEHLLRPRFGQDLPQALENIDKLRQVAQRNPLIHGERSFTQWIYSPEAKTRIITLLGIVISVILAVFVAKNPEAASDLFDRVFFVLAERSYWAVLVLLTILLAQVLLAFWMLNMLWQSILLACGVQSYAIRVLLNDCYRYAYASDDTLRDFSKLPWFAVWSIALITRLGERTRQLRGER